MDHRPPPGARVVGRGRISSIPIWSLILLIGVSGIVVGGMAMALIVGVPFTLLGLFGLAMLARTRVWVDGPTVYSRTLLRYNPPIRLDELAQANLNQTAQLGRELWLVQRDGTTVRLDATNQRLMRLYKAMAPYVPLEVANDRLRQRLERFRDGIGLPLG